MVEDDQHDRPFLMVHILGRHAPTFNPNLLQTITVNM